MPQFVYLGNAIFATRLIERISIHEAELHVMTHETVVFAFKTAKAAKAAFDRVKRILAGDVSTSENAE